MVRIVLLVAVAYGTLCFIFGSVFTANQLDPVHDVLRISVITFAVAFAAALALVLSLRDRIRKPLPPAAPKRRKDTPA